MKTKKRPGAGDAGSRGSATSSNAAKPNPKIAEGKASPTMLDAALAYAARGWEIFPADTSKKKSYKSKKYSNGKNWGMTKDPEEIKRDFRQFPRAGIGLPTGSINGFFVIEGDTKKGHDVDGLASIRALEAAHEPFPVTRMAESPSGSVHYYFKLPPGLIVKNSSSELAPGVDVRGEGGMVIAPPSIRTDGVYKLLNDGDPADPPGWLVERLGQRSNGKASSSIDHSEPVPDYLKDIGPVGISDHPNDLTPKVPLETIEAALAAIQRNRKAVTHERFIGIGCGIFKQLGEEKGFGVFHSFAKRLRGEHFKPRKFLEQWDSIVTKNGYGWNIGTLLHLANEADPDWRLAIHSGQIEEQIATHKAPEPKTEKANSEPTTPYQGPLLFDPWAPYIVPEFPFDTLPPVLHDFVASQSAVVGGDPSALAMATLAACSGALDHRFSLKMMKHGSWTAHPRLWVLMVGPPSSRRTPLINVACAPLEAYQSNLSREYQLALKEYERAKVGNKDLEKPAPPPRYVVWDSTIEKLGEMLSRTAKGVLLKRDEFAGLIGSMEKYGHGRGSALDRAFYLKAYDGGPFSIDRVQRGEMYVENLSISILGGIQPDRLVELHGLASDGFLQRCIPIMMRPGELAKDLPTDDPAYERFIRKLIAATPNEFSLTDQAREKMDELRAYLHSLEQASVGLQAGFNTFVGKLHGVAGSLALILYLATNPDFDSMTARVDLPIVESAQRIILDFVTRHAFEFYRTTESTTTDRLRQLASYVLTSGETRFTPSDFTRNVASMRGLDLRQVNERVSLLVAAEWLVPVSKGLDNRSWTLNGFVNKQFAERRRLEEEQKQQIAELMGSPRKGADL